MAIERLYKVVQPRPEVREGRSFNPDEFAIAWSKWLWEPRRRTTRIPPTFSRAPASQKR